MSGFEVAVGFLGAWAAQKVRRVAGRADTEVDRALDSAMDDLHELVSTRLGGEPALRELTGQTGEAGAEAPAPSCRGGHATHATINLNVQNGQATAVADVVNVTVGTPPRPGTNQS